MIRLRVASHFTLKMTLRIVCYRIDGRLAKCAMIAIRAIMHVS
jgi:hypothetical protein